MVLRTQVKNKIINEVIWNGETAKPGKWKVLVVDNLTLKTVSSVIKMHELATQGRINTFHFTVNFMNQIVSLFPQITLLPASAML